VEGEAGPEAGTAAPVSVAGCEVRARLGAVAAAGGSPGADAAAGALLDLVLLRDDLLRVAGSVVEAGAEESAEAVLSLDRLDFFVPPASGVVAADDPPVAVSSVAFFLLDDLVDEAVPVEASVSAEPAALLLFLEDFGFDVSDDAVELSEEVADFLDFLDFLVVVVVDD